MSHHSPHHYTLIIEYQNGHRTVFSPDFDFRFTIPTNTDPHRYSVVAMQMVEREIELRLKALDSKGLPHPVPIKWREISAAPAETPAIVEILNVNEVSKMLGISESSVRRLVDAGKLPAQTTAGGHRRFLRADVEALSR